MTLALTAIVSILGFWMLSRLRIARAAAGMPALLLVAGGAASLFLQAFGAQPLPTDLIAAAAETGLAALVFVSAAQLRVSKFARRCPASFRLTLGGAPLFLIVCSLCAFILLPQLSLPSALLLGGALMLNGAAFDRRAVIDAPAPSAIKAAVRIESAAIIAFGAPVAILLAANAVAASPNEPAAAPLFFASIEVLKGFALGGAIGYLAARFLGRRAYWRGGRAAAFAGLAAFLLAPLLGAEPIIAAGAAGLLWGEETDARDVARLRLRRMVEQSVAPAAYLMFGFALAGRVLQADLLSVLFAAAAVTVMRAGPRLATLQSSKLPKESQAFLAWFGGAPGAASALFILSLVDDAMIVDHEGFLTVGALAVVAGVFAARITSRPLANAFLRQTALAKRRRMYAG